MPNLINSVSVDALLAARDHVQENFRRIAELHKESLKHAAQFGIEVPDLCARFSCGGTRQVEKEDTFDYLPLEVDRHVWSYLLRQTQVDTLMSSAKRKEYHAKLCKSMYYGPDKDSMPELTEENIEATLMGTAGAQYEYFLDCVEAAYRRLSWDHKTNSPVGFRPKLIIQWAVSPMRREWQGDKVHLHASDALCDLERVLHLLAKYPVPTHEVGIRSIGYIPYGKWVEVPSGSLDGSLMKIKVFRNSNAHVVIHRQDLVDEMNRIMADLHPDALSPKEGKTKRKPAQKKSGSLKVQQQAFYTPDAVVQEVWRMVDRNPENLLEPSAGVGNMIKHLGPLAHGLAVEQDPCATQQLRNLDMSGLRVWEGDFLECTPSQLGYFDVIVMNPPFANGQEVDHVEHALSFLQPGGVLVSVMSQAIRSRNTARYTELREELERRGAEITDLPDGSFKESGTNVRTVLVRVVG